MSILSEYFGGGKRNPAEEAGQYLDQIPSATRPYYDPYIQRGERAGAGLEDKFGQLLNDPTGFLDKIMSGYETSGDYNRKKDIFGQEIGATAAAGGVAGTPMHQRQQAEMVDKLLSSDMQQYLSNALGLFNTGVKGEQDFYNKGYGASGSMADIIGNELSSKAGLAYEDAKSQNANRNNLISSLTKLLGQGIGYGAGGPFGSIIGGGMAGPMSGSRYKPWNNPG